jgi:hypothetical protein
MPFCSQFSFNGNVVPDECRSKMRNTFSHLFHGQVMLTFVGKFCCYLPRSVPVADKNQCVIFGESNLKLMRKIKELKLEIKTKNTKKKQM